MSSLRRWSASLRVWNSDACLLPTAVVTTVSCGVHMLRNDVLGMLKELSLNGAHSAYDELLEQGRRTGSTPEKILLALLRAEKAERHMRSIRYRLGIAKFPVMKDLEGFDFPSSTVIEGRIRTLCQGGFMEARTNVVFVGGTGTGKTHLSVAIGTQCIRNGARVRVFNLLDLVNKLEREKTEGKAGHLADTLARFDLIILERLNEEIKRRTLVVRIFPNEESCLRLIRALAIETHENWIEANRYLDMSLLTEMKKKALMELVA